MFGTAVFMEEAISEAASRASVWMLNQSKPEQLNCCLRDLFSGPDCRNKTSGRNFLTLDALQL